MSTSPQRRETYSTIAEANSPRPGENRPREDKEVAQVVSGGSLAKALLGAGAIVLIILAFTGVVPKILTHIAAIAVGSGLLLEGIAIAAEYKKILERVHYDPEVNAELGGGVGTETLLGVGVIVLGILSLFGLVPLVLNAVAAITAGVAVVFTADLLGHLNQVHLGHAGQHDTVIRATHLITSSAAGVQVIAGVAAIVLGILSLIGVAPMLLTKVAWIILGAALLLSGIESGGRMITPVYR